MHHWRSVKREHPSFPRSSVGCAVAGITGTIFLEQPNSACSEFGLLPLSFRLVCLADCSPENPGQFIGRQCSCGSKLEEGVHRIFFGLRRARCCGSKAGSNALPPSSAASKTIVRAVSLIGGFGAPSFDQINWNTPAVLPPLHSDPILLGADTTRCIPYFLVKQDAAGGKPKPTPCSPQMLLRGQPQPQNY